MRRTDILKLVLARAKDPGASPIIEREMDTILSKFRPGTLDRLYSLGGPESEPFKPHGPMGPYTRGQHLGMPEESHIRLKGVVPEAEFEKLPFIGKGEYATAGTAGHELIHVTQFNPKNYKDYIGRDPSQSYVNPSNFFYDDIYYNSGDLISNLQKKWSVGIGNSRELVAESLSQYMLKGEKALEGLPNHFKTAVHHWFDKYRALILTGGAAGAMGLGMGLAPEQAEAFQVGKAAPLTEAVKSLQGKPFSISSAAEALKGKFIQGMEILDVLTKGKGEERFVLLKNPETEQVFQWPIDKEALATLAATKGYETYMERFKALGAKNPLGKFEQAQVSADARIEKGLTGTLKEVRPWTESYLTKAHRLSPFGESNLEEMPDLVYVRWKGQTMHFPRWYAEFLQYEQKKPTNRYIKNELQDFKVLKTEPKYYQKFAESRTGFNPKEEYQYAIIDENGMLKFEDEAGKPFKATGDEMEYWVSKIGMQKQKEMNIKILTLSDLEDYITKLGGMA